MSLAHTMTVLIIFGSMLLPTLSESHQLSLKEQIDDFEQMAELLNSGWANRERHEQLSGILLSERLQKAYSLLLRPPVMSNHQYGLFISRFLNSLEDGHIEAEMSKLIDYDYSRNQFTFADSTDGLIVTSCSYNCNGISIPSKVYEIDGIDSESWLQSRMRYAIGSTTFGKRADLIRRLSARGEGIGVISKPRLITVVKTYANGNSTKRHLVLDWQWSDQTEPKNEACVQSEVKSSTLVLRVPTFACQSSAEHSGSDKFSLDLLKAMSVKQSYNKVMIDLRGNPGGLPDQAKELMSYFIENDLFWFSVKNIQFGDEGGPYADYANPKVNPPQLSHLKSIPLWLLTDGGCFSQCPILVLAAKLGNRAKIVGSNMDAGAGSYMNEYWNAPSGMWSLSVPPWVALAADGQFIEGHSLRVDVPALPSLEDYKAYGERAPVEKALAKINF